MMEETEPEQRRRRGERDDPVAGIDERVEATANAPVAPAVTSIRLPG